MFVDEHRDGPAPLTNRGRDLRYLLVGMRSSIAGIRDELRERPALNLIRRPSKFPALARALCAPASMGNLPCVSADRQMKGLVIDEPWISLIISGEKTWEMRSRNTVVRGRIALIRKGSKTAPFPSRSPRYSTRLVIGELLRRALHEVAARADQSAANSPVKGQLGAADRVDHNAGGVWRIPDFELQLARIGLPLRLKRLGAVTF
jgi:hypothetical protein